MKTVKHKISVVVPTYYAERYLKGAIDSILNQIKAEYFGNQKTLGRQFAGWWKRNNEADLVKCGILDFLNTTPICHPSVMFNNCLFKQYNLN